MYTIDHHLEQQKLDTNYHINRQLFVIVLISPVVAQFGAEPKTTIWGMESRRWHRKALVQRKGPGSLHWRAGASVGRGFCDHSERSELWSCRAVEL